ncbi:MAG: peptidylprolyl isomerase [Bacteroidales bacterium]|nr:peptidylprolyl isomerase [Bacteroidales bacterium]
MKKLLFIALTTCLLVASCKTRSGQNVTVDLTAQDSLAAVKAAQALPEEPVFDIVTSEGTIRVRLFKDTPLHRDNFAKLALAGYYDNLLFHRVINGFVIQGGDPFTRDTSLVAQWGEGGPSYTIKAEMRDAEGNPLHTHVKGALAAARQGDLANPFKESSGSQFYLVQDPDHCTHLDGEYTVFGETIAGLHVIDRIAAQPTDRMDRPIDDVKIITIKPNKELNSK